MKCIFARPNEIEFRSVHIGDLAQLQSQSQSPSLSLSTAPRRRHLPCRLEAEKLLALLLLLLLSQSLPLPLRACALQAFRGAVCRCRCCCFCSRCCCLVPKLSTQDTLRPLSALIPLLALPLPGVGAALSLSNQYESSSLWRIQQTRFFFKRVLYYSTHIIYHLRRCMIYPCFVVHRTATRTETK